LGAAQPVAPRRPARQTHATAREVDLASGQVRDRLLAFLLMEALPSEFEITIEKIVTGGAGLGRREGLTVFVPSTAPGDRVRVRVVRQRASFVEAALVEVLSPGPDRRQSPCPHGQECGGCDLQHLTEPAQRRIKAEIVSDCFRRLGGLAVDPILTGPEPAGPPLGYRNRVRLFADGTGRYGMRRRASHEVIPLESCAQAPSLLSERILPWLVMLPPVEQVVIRLDGRGGFLVMLYGPASRLRPLRTILGDVPPGKPPLPGLVGLLLNNRPVWGRDHLVYHVAGHKYRVHGLSFFQANLAETEAIVALLRKWLRAADRQGFLADLYCGVGLFGVALADLAEHVLAVEQDPLAVRDARNNVARDALARGRVEVKEGTVASVLSGAGPVAGHGWREGAVLLDPPRPGLGDPALQALLIRAPRHIFYLSCDPATQARDAARLAAAGYEPVAMRVFDMFPQTSHVETLLHLRRDGSAATAT
jgi:23S rRNA (uracil1939-C5)-methyltransferase